MKPIDDQRIDDYLLQKLEGSALTSFQKELESDSELAAELKLRQQVLEELDALSDYKAQQQISAVHQREISKFKKGGRRVFMFRRLAVAAVFAILAFSVWWMSDTTSPEELFADNYVAPTFMERSTSDAQDDLFKGTKLYNDNDYAASIPLLSKAFQQNPENTELHLIIGISLFETGKSQGALQQFDYLIRKNDILFKDKALWYSALISLKEGDIENAKAFLSQISRETAGKELYEDAQEILGDL